MVLLGSVKWNNRGDLGSVALKGNFLRKVPGFCVTCWGPNQKSDVAAIKESCTLCWKGSDLQ